VRRGGGVGDRDRRGPARGGWGDVARRDPVAPRDDSRPGDRVRVVDADADGDRDGTHWASSRTRPLGDDRDGDTARQDRGSEPSAALSSRAVSMLPPRVCPAPTSPAGPGGPRAVELRDVARSARPENSTPLASNAS